MSNGKKTQTPGTPALPVKALQASPVPATPLPSTKLGQAVQLETRAGLLDMVMSGAAVKVAKNEADVRELQAKAAGSIGKTIRSIKEAQADILEIEEMADEADIKRIERERRKKRAENALMLDDQNRPIENSVAAVQANQTLKDAQAAAQFQDLSNEAQIREQRIKVMRLKAEEDELGRQMHVAALPPAPPPGPDPTEAMVRYVVRDAAADLVSTDAQHLYHAYAGCHYLAALLAGVPQKDAVKDTYDLVLERARLHPLDLQEALACQRRYETFKGVLRSRQAADQSAAAERQRVEAQIEIERLRKEVEEHRVRFAQEMSSAFGYVDYDPKKQPGKGDEPTN